MLTFELGEGGLLFPNEVGGAPRRTVFRSRHWRPALVRAGLLGSVVEKGDKFEAAWSTGDGRPHREQFAAIKTVAREQAGGLRFHGLRHSYATWLVDDGVPPNMVQRVMGARAILDDARPLHASDEQLRPHPPRARR